MGIIDFIIIGIITILFILSIKSAIKNKGCCGDCTKCGKKCKE